MSSRQAVGFNSKTSCVILVKQFLWKKHAALTHGSNLQGGTLHEQMRPFIFTSLTGHSPPDKHELLTVSPIVVFWTFSCCFRFILKFLSLCDFLSCPSTFSVCPIWISLSYILLIFPSLCISVPVLPSLFVLMQSCVFPQVFWLFDWHFFCFRLRLVFGQLLSACSLRTISISPSFIVSLYYTELAQKMFPQNIVRHIVSGIKLDSSEPTCGSLLGLGACPPAYKLPINSRYQKPAVSHPRRPSALHHTLLVNLASPARGLCHKNSKYFIKVMWLLCNECRIQIKNV